VQDDDVLLRLTAALHDRVEPDLDAIVAAARDAAIAEATSVLQAVMTRSILERVADHLDAALSAADVPPPKPIAEPLLKPFVELPPEPTAEPSVPEPTAEPSVPEPTAERPVEPPPPAPSPEPTGGRESPWVWYVYGIQLADGSLAVAVDGVVGAAVDSVEAAGLRAIVSRASPAELGEQALQARLEDFPWVAANAQAHEAVLAAAMQAGAVLPLRFGTVFRDRDAVVDVLIQHADALHAEADRMTGYSEWGAKVLVDVAACDSWIEEHISGVAVTSSTASADQTGGEARAYLVRRQAERGAREVRRVLLLDVATEVHERLSALAVEAASDPPQPPELSEYRGEMVLNGAYLLDDPSIGLFHEAASELADRHAAKGITLETTGPWPAHHFITLPPIDRDVGEPA
jgi:Gas vesicle synthesis protein GvpL/GvpF